MAVHREVVVGVADEQQDTAAVEFAFQEAVLRKARLLAVHAWLSAPVAGAPPRPVARGQARAGPHELLAGAEAWLEALLAAWREKYPQVQADRQVILAHPGRVLAGASARADLVVLGRRAVLAPHGPGAGSVIHAVLSHAHGPGQPSPGN